MPTSLVWVLLTIAILIGRPPAESRAQSVESPPATTPQPKPEAANDEEIPRSPVDYMGRRIARTMHYAGAPWLVRESREREEECSKLMKALEIKPGQT